MGRGFKVSKIRLTASDVSSVWPTEPQRKAACGTQVLDTLPQLLESPPPAALVIFLWTWPLTCSKRGVRTWATSKDRIHPTRCRLNQSHIPSQSTSEAGQKAPPSRTKKQIIQRYDMLNTLALPACTGLEMEEGHEGPMATGEGAGLKASPCPVQRRL